MQSDRHLGVPCAAASAILAALAVACGTGPDRVVGEAASVGETASVEEAVDGVTVTVAYGEEPAQFGVLRRPTGSGAWPVVILIHGGFWKSQYGLDLMDPLASDLVERGYAVWNIEYRRVGEPGGGWPGTLEDVAAAVDHLATLADEHGLDLSQVSVVGHSAGGHLALWVAGRGQLAAGTPGAQPVVVPAVAIGQGPVVDLVAGAEAGLGGGAVTSLLGGLPSEVPDRYAVALPRSSGSVVLYAVVGSDDTIVPPRFSTLTPGGDVEVVTVPGADHFDLINPEHAAWTAVVQRLP